MVKFFTRNTFRMVLGILFLLAGITQLQAQNYPIQANLNVKLPYSLYLSDYSSPVKNKIQANVILLDREELEYKVKFRITLKGNSFTLTTKPGAYFEPHYLQPTVMETIGSDVLGQYFHPDNFIVQSGNYTTRELLNSGKLPEGVYEFTLEVLDYDRGVRVSNVARKMMWLMLNDPPIINQPADGVMVEAVNPQNIVFQWTPQHLSSPNAAFTTEYEFTLVEVMPEGRNPNDAMINTPPVYQTIVDNNMLVYSQNMPALIPGRRYAVQVQARDKEGRDLFKNQGRSQVTSFVFGSPCQPPVEFSSRMASPSMAVISWGEVAQAGNYVVRYREKQNDQAAWFEVSAASASVSLKNLKPEMEYEFQVKSACGAAFSDYSLAGSFTTPEELVSEVELKCGDDAKPQAIDNREPVEELEERDIVKVGDFAMVITELKDNGGTYEGKGLIFVPYMFTTFKTTFNAIKINTDYEVFEGEIKTASTGSSLLSAAEIEEIRQQTRPELSLDICQPEQEVEDDVLTFNEGDVVIVLEDEEIKKGDTIIVNGEEVVVDENTKIEPDDEVIVNGKIVKTGGSGSGGNDDEDDPGGAQAPGESDVVSGGIPATGTGVGQPSAGLVNGLKRDLKGLLNDIQSGKEDSLRAARIRLEEASQRILQLVSENNYVKEVIAGSDGEFLKEGLSQHINIPQASGKFREGAIGEIYELHREAYEADLIIKQLVPELEEIDEMLSRSVLKQLKEEVNRRMTFEEQEELDSYENDETTFNAYLEKTLRFILQERLVASGQLVSSLNQPQSGADYMQMLALLKSDNMDQMLAWLDRYHEYRGGMSGINPSWSPERDLMDPAMVKKYDDQLKLESNLSLRAHSLHKIIMDYNRKVGSYDPLTPMELPVGIGAEAGGMEYIMSIEDMVFTPTGAKFNAFMSMEVPSSGQKLAFFVKDVPFTPLGLSSAAPSRLELANDIPMRLSNQVQLNIIGSESNTYVNFDCNGFESFGLQGRFEFCESWIVPEGPDGQPGEGRVQAEFMIGNMKSWDDLLVEVNIAPFQLTKRPGFSFYVNEAVLDLSDLQNPTSIVFPEGYESSYFIEGNNNLWRGFFLKEGYVKLPKGFNNKDAPDERLTIGARNLIIDNTGFSGEVYGANLLTLEQGDMNGWAYSLDTLLLKVDQNAIVKGQFSGQVLLPIQGDKSQVIANPEGGGDSGLTPLNYQGLLQKDNYVLQVSTPGTIKFNIFAAEATLEENSTIEIAYRNDRFYPKATLHGQMDINGADDTKIAGVKFRELVLQTEAPYIQAEYFSFDGGTSSFSDFPLSISDVGLRTEGLNAGIEFTGKVNLMKSSEEGFAGDVTLTVWGKMKEDEGIQSWEYDRVKVSQVSIAIKKGDAFSLNGSIAFFEQDLTYGKGFRGSVQATFSGMEMKAMALFGKVDGYRYWYADAMFISNTGIPIYPPVVANGFGGGAYYRMTMAGPDQAVESPYGTNQSGLVYIPNSEMGLGIKASVAISIQNAESAFNGEVTFEVNFTRHGGIDKMALSGNGYFLSDQLQQTADLIQDQAALLAATGETPERRPAAISGDLLILFDFTNGYFHGDLRIYVDMAGVIEGVGRNGEAGWAVVHFGKDNWYIHIGTPDNPVGLRLLKILKTESYMMVGKEIPGSPPPPEKVEDILGGRDLDYMRDLNALGTGKGFAFGSRLEVDTGDLSFLIFYGRFQAGVGFDIMLKNYDGAHCQGKSGEIGINGWYANGQAFAYVEGEIGIKVKIFFKKKKFHILTIGAATVFQTKAPNPFWMSGRVGGRYSILGGLIKGRCSFEVTIGNECKIVTTDPLPDFDVIAEITPTDGENDISVFNVPQAIFNIPIEKEFVYKDLDYRIRKYKVKLDHMKVTTGGQMIDGEHELNSDKTVLAFNAYDVLPPEKVIKVDVSVSFQEWVNGRWTIVKDENGSKFIETLSSNFMTGKAPDHIPADNIRYSYPMAGQKNFYKSESGKGYIRLIRGQDYLFQLDEEWVQRAVFTDESSSTLMTALSYNLAQNEVSFNIPQALVNSKEYTLQLKNLPAQAAQSIDQNVKKVETKLTSENGLDATVTKREAQGELNILEAKEIYNSEFRTSKYNRFEDRFSSGELLVLSGGVRQPVDGYIYRINSHFNTNEPFSQREIEGDANIDPLVRLEAKVQGNDYFENDIYPIVYEGLPLSGNINISWRNRSKLGDFATRAMDFDIKTAYTGSYSNQSFGLVYNLPYYYYHDMADLSRKVANYYAKYNTINARMRRLLESDYPIMPPGIYPLFIRYYLPGKNKLTSEKLFILRVEPDVQ